MLGALLLVLEQVGRAAQVLLGAGSTGRVPAIGRVSTSEPFTFTSGSGDAPAIAKPSNSRKHI